MSASKYAGFLDGGNPTFPKRGLCFVRYADDCVIFVGSKRAGDRVMESVSRFIEKKLRLEVNREKSAVGRPWERKYLGFCLTNSRKNPKIRIHWKTIKRFKQRVREITARRRGRSLSKVIDELNQFMSGWWNYYGLTASFNRLRPLPHWIRRRLRALVWLNLSSFREEFEYAPFIFKVEYDSIRLVMFSLKTTIGLRLVEPTPRREEAQNPCEGTPEKRGLSQFCRNDGMCPQGSLAYEQSKVG